MHITSRWRQAGREFERTFELVEGNEVIETFDSQPSLDQLRQAERDFGQRINLSNVGLPCSSCGAEIGDRFTADTGGNLLCWDCASTADAVTENGLSINSDPTKAIISGSSLYKKSLADYVINVATGCRHGCKFCYVPTSPAIDSREELIYDRADVGDSQSEWGSYLLYRDDLPERLHRRLENSNPREWDQTDRGRGVVMLSSGTDCYQDRRAAQITRGVVQELTDYGIPVRILTRSPAVVRDLDLFKQVGDYVTVGSSIPSFDEDLVRALEPNAPPPKARWRALETLKRNGIRVYVSYSPTYPMTDSEFWNMLTHFKALNPEVIFHEPINPRGSNFKMCLNAALEAGYTRVANELKAIRDDHGEWVRYALRQINTVQQLAHEIGGLSIHSWPDQELINSTTGNLRMRLLGMRQSISIENHPTDHGSPPDSDAQSELGVDMQSIKTMISV